MNKNAKWIGAGVAFMLLSPLGVRAQENPDNTQQDQLPDRFAINLGASYLFDSDTRFALRSEEFPIGTSVSFQRDLNGEQSVTGPFVNGYYRFNPRHRLDFGFQRYERTGNNIIDHDIIFADRLFPAGSGIKTTITTDAYKLAYTYSFYHVDKVELGATVGALIASYDFKLENANRTIASDKSFTEPLPEVGFRMDYAITPRWHTLLNLDTFYIELNSKYRGSLDDFRLALEDRVSRNVVLGASVSRIAVDAEINDGSFRGFVSDLYRAGQLYVGLRY